MGWKNWAYWKKGGIIGLVFGIILSIFAFLDSFFLSTNYIPYFVYNLLFGPIVILILILLCPGGDYCLMDTTLPIFIALILEYFAVGAIIGLIVGKIKKRKK
jgi:hypothetical protein